MRDRTSHWETQFAKMSALRDACKDPSAALYVIAYLVAGRPDEFLDDCLTAMREWQAANAPQRDLEIVYDPRD